MNPKDDTYREFVDSVEKCVRELAEQHGIDVEVVVEKGEVTLVSFRGELDEGKPIQLTTIASADLARNLRRVSDQVGVNEAIDLHGRDPVPSGFSTEGKGGALADAGAELEQDELPDLSHRHVERVIRSKEEIAHECERLSE